MTVKIIMERTVKPEQEGELQLLLRQLRIMAIGQPGYISGETLISCENPGKQVVISTWNSLQEWNRWQSHPDRVRVASQIEALLTSPPNIAVYMEQWVPVPQEN